MSTATKPSGRTVRRGERIVRVTIKRQDAPGAAARWERFDVPIEPGANITSVLQWIAANPTTVEGKRSTPVVYDSGCLEEVCGSCTMVVNGKVRQACSALMDDLCPGAGDEVILEPMTKFPVLRDLSVDRSRLFSALKRVRAWVPVDGTYDLGPGPRESAEKQETRYVLSTCMSCGCCLEACPQYTLEADEKKWDSSFVGAAVLSQARYFNEHETGRTLEKVRLDELSRPGGVSDCGNAQNCVRVCPKEIPLTESIGAVGRSVTLHRLKQFFTGR
ncbi:MAG TPA: succinate dehydrogenase iron-sulfur subunit [Phycisphaerales bacterium]|nr:succinate dehydrogenase iron-sulfur subunit [Phycisphaerales bacterium]